MWILEWLPNWLFYAIFFAGLLGLLASYVMKFIPLVYIYKTPIQLGSIIAIVFGTYMAGAISNQEAWEARVKEMELKVAAAEVQSAKKNKTAHIYVYFLCWPKKKGENHTHPFIQRT